MKKIIVYLFFIFSFAGLTAAPSFGGTAEFTSANERAERSVDQMVNRLHEIKEMDKKSLTKEEKKELRTEVKEIKKDLKEKRIAPGVYVSGAALILAIVLLLILL
jgi:hypothetical protein